jgi:hypothetical protein
MRPFTACWRTSAAGSAGFGRQFRGPPPRRISGDFCKGGSSPAPTPPSAVDPTALGNAQLAANVGTAQSQAQLNNIGTYSPWGTSIYSAGSIDPTTGKPSSYNLRQSLSDPLSSLFDQQTNLASIIGRGYEPYLGAAGPNGPLSYLAATPLSIGGNMARSLPQGLDLSGVPNIGMLSPGSFRTNVTGGAGGQAIPGAVTNLPLQTSVVPQGVPALTQQAQNAAYQGQTQYLDPQFNQTEETLRQHLADQGIQEGSPAFTRAMGDFDRQKQMAYSNAGVNAVQAGNAQEQALYGQALAGGQFTNQALLQGGAFTNAAQQQLFGQGMSLADLYNQAQQAASGQNLQAQQANLARTQAAFGAPWNAAENFVGLGSNLYNLGLGTMGAALSGVNAVPSWPVSIPTMGGAPATVAPANLAQAAAAGTASQQARYAAQGQNFSNLGGLGLLGGQALFGGGGGGGLLGGLAGTPFTAAPELGGFTAESALGSDFIGGAGTLADLGMAGATAGGGGGILGGILGGIGLALSDRRLKTDITPIGMADSGLPLSMFRYLGDPVPRIGLMADEVEKLRPEAVRDGPLGFKMVDYGRALAPA